MFSSITRKEMLPPGMLASHRRLRAKVCSRKRETEAHSSTLLGQFLAEYASFSRSARISSCLAGKMGGKNVMTPTLLRSSQLIRPLFRT